MPHPPEAKAQARQVYEQAGPVAAAQATGIPYSTIRAWAREEQWPRGFGSVIAAEAGKTVAMASAARLGWHTRRRNMADLIGEIGAELLEKIREDLAKRDRVNMRDAAILFGVLMDKAELLTAATGGTTGLEVMSDTDRRDRLVGILDELVDREAAGDG